jgi:hypothetical protein
MKRIDIATPEEVLESEMVIIQGAGIEVKHVGWQNGPNGGFHLYDILKPKIAGYIYGNRNGNVTLSLEGMKEKGLIS